VAYEDGRTGGYEQGWTDGRAEGQADDPNRVKIAGSFMFLSDNVQR